MVGLLASLMILVKIFSISLSLLIKMSSFSILGTNVGWEMFKLLELLSRGKFSVQGVGFSWVKAGLTGLAISDWLGTLVTSAKEIPSLTELGTIEF